MIKNPKGIEETNYNTTGAWVAAPTFARIIKRMVNILSIIPVENKNYYNANLNKMVFEGNNIATF